MNYYESVVVDYLRADRAIFVNTECCIQVNQADNPDSSGAHWYCDAVAVDFRSKEIFLCEISYAAELTALLKRLKGWHDNWDAVRHALSRDSFLPESWPVRPWLFVPEENLDFLLKALGHIGKGEALKFTTRITTLEMVQPWRYASWNRVGEKAKPVVVPEAMAI
jgi:hypothetical protein